MSPFASKWILWTLLFVNFFLVIAGNIQLKQVHLLFRHGDRAPTGTYPKDHWKYAWPDGLGQLTTLGMQQQYHTGEYLRKRYGNLINNTYNRHTVHVQSTDVDRTLMSAYANLAGFLPPTGRHVWNTNLTWQPIPVHTLPQKDDYVLSLNSKCPKYTKLHAEEMKSSEAEKINFENRVLFKTLAQKTGLPITSFSKASSLYDILLIEQIHNLTQPSWVNNELMKILSELHVYKISLLTKTHQLRRLFGGSLVGEMVNNMKNSIYEAHLDKHKIFMYSAHDVTVVSLLSALGVFEPHAPPYCSMVMVELLRENRTEFVKILYRNDTSRDPYELTIKGCSSPCPFEQFRELTASVVPEDIKAECAIHKQKHHHKSSSIAFQSVTAAIIFCCALIILAVAGYGFYKRKTSTYQYINIDN